MKNKKVIVLVVLLILIVLLLVGYFGIRVVKKGQYTKADSYEVGGVKISSVNKVVGEKKVTKYSSSNGDIKKLELTFKDSDKENTIEKYLNYIKENEGYINTQTKGDNIKQIASSKDQGVVTIKTETTSDGFVLTIEVGDATFEVAPIEE